jgi:hypothetical protein
LLPDRTAVFGLQTGSAFSIFLPCELQPRQRGAIAQVAGFLRRLGVFLGKSFSGKLSF